MSGESSVRASRTWLIENRLMHVLCMCMCMCSALSARAKRHTAGVSEAFVIWFWFTQHKGTSCGAAQSVSSFCKY